MKGGVYYISDKDWDSYYVCGLALSHSGLKHRNVTLEEHGIINETVIKKNYL